MIKLFTRDKSRPGALPELSLSRASLTKAMKIENRYLDGTYLSSNPDWDCSDSLWKAKLVEHILEIAQIDVNSFVEVGCGSGYVLLQLSKVFSNALFTGYDVSPQLQSFWESEAFLKSKNVIFKLSDFHSTCRDYFDVLLMLDVFEHVRDPFTFLEESRKFARFFIFHIPLDLSAQSVLRLTPLIDVRNKVGHLNSYTKELALQTLKDCGYTIIMSEYSGDILPLPLSGLSTRCAALPRKVLSFFNKDFSVRLLGGETLVVLAK